MDDPFARPIIRTGLFYRDPPAALDWLEKAFGFRRTMDIRDEDGHLVHAEMSFGGFHRRRWGMVAACRQPALDRRQEHPDRLRSAPGGDRSALRTRPCLRRRDPSGTAIRVLRRSRLPGSRSGGPCLDLFTGDSECRSARGGTVGRCSDHRLAPGLNPQFFPGKAAGNRPNGGLRPRDQRGSAGVTPYGRLAA